eukprot:jgi/Bigna1/139889/aug1.53_g14597
MILSDDRFRPAPPVEELASRKVELENGKFVKDVPESTCRAAGAQLRVSDEPDLSGTQLRLACCTACWLGHSAVPELPGKLDAFKFELGQFWSSGVLELGEAHA